jgi:hypothetical protein
MTKHTTTAAVMGAVLAAFADLAQAMKDFEAVTLPALRRAATRMGWVDQRAIPSRRGVGRQAPSSPLNGWRKACTKKR